MKVSDFKKQNLPDKPGVYFFLYKKQILYIGKATNLKDRAKSYFGKDLIHTRGPLILDMVFKAQEIKFQATDSVLEALILEASLIKKYQPYYNTKEKSDKSFNYVCLTKDKKLALVRGKSLDKKSYNAVFGPFPNGGQLKEALKIIRKIFPYIEEKKGIKGREAFYKQINLIPANTEENKKNIQNIKLLFQGKKKKIILNLKKEMLFLAKQKKFEEADKIKRKIFALQHINDIALLKEESNGVDLFLSGPRSSFVPSEARDSARPFQKQIHPVSRTEAYDIAHMGGKNMVGVMVVLEDGEVNKNEYRKFKIKTQKDANDTGALREVLERRFNHAEWRFPDIIVLDGSIAQINVMNQIIKDLSVKTARNLNVSVVAVTKDDRHKAKEIKGEKDLVSRYKREILLANNEAHRFAINYHKNMRNKNFLK